MRIWVVETGEDLSTRNVAYAIERLHLADEATRLEISHLDGLDRNARRVEGRFKLTPEPLLASWRMSELLQARTKPGDVVVMSDYMGLGGVFAVSQAAAPEEERRQLWTVAGDSTYLELRLVAQSHEGLPMPLESRVDWEITQYLWSARVVTPSERAQVELTRIGAHSEPLESEIDHGVGSRPPDPTHVWVPDRVSRRSQTGEILRALTTIGPHSIAISDRDTDDGVWTGSTWNAVRHSRSLLGDRLSRTSAPSPEATTVILGDPYAIPDESMLTLHRRGVPMVVPRGSVASALWPNAPVWEGADELVAALTGRETQVDGGAHFDPPPSSAIGTNRGRISVSVGIPVFEDVRFLDDCVESVLGQEMPAVEIVLIDDGSRSPAVAEALNRLSRFDSRIRTMKAEHRGVCVVRNLMLQSMTGNAFLMLDSDDVLLPDFLSSCARVLSKNADIWAVATWTEFFEGYEGVEAKPPFDARVGRRENPIISTAALVDMRVREIGIRFAPDLAFLYCEDWHFWSQIVAAGGRFGLVPKPLVRHRVHPSSGGHMRTDLAYAIGKARATEPLHGVT